MRGVWGILVAAAILAGPAAAQDETLADIRQQLIIVNNELQKLKRELSTTGGPSVGVGAGELLDRVNTIESELTRLTSKTEELEFRIGRVVSNGENQLGDLNFRVCELEEACDIGALPVLKLDDAQTPVVQAPTEQPQTNDGTQLAANEKEDFERASEALASGDFQGAADQFAAFNQTYPGGPLGVAADLRRGEALDGLGDAREAAKAYLEAFRLDQTGPLAPEALYLLGRALGTLGQQNEACVTLGEVGARFPGGDAEARASEEMLALGCS